MLNGINQYNIFPSLRVEGSLLYFALCYRDVVIRRINIGNALNKLRVTKRLCLP